VYSPTVRFFFLHLVVLASPLVARERSNVELPAAVSSAPMPDYPFAARSRYLQGQGKFLIQFDAKTGHATKIETIRSTGYAVLDEAAIGALRRWIVKPHSCDVMEVPINFKLDGLKATTVRAATERTGKEVILYSPWPRFPLAAAAHGVAGSGRYLLRIDPHTGQVVEVQILQTMHDQRLDDAAVKTLRQWRFKPNTVRKFVVPIDFDLGYG
jgi:TonB family protein